MPLTLNVGASRKITDGNFGSRGASLHLELDLDYTLLMDPAHLQERIRQLYGVIRQALLEELQKDSNNSAQLPAPSDALSPASFGPPTNGKPATNGKPNGKLRLASPAQIKALYAIAKEQGADLIEALRHHYGLENPEDLSLRQASGLIDLLKSGAEAPTE